MATRFFNHFSSPTSTCLFLQIDSMPDDGHSYFSYPSFTYQDFMVLDDLTFSIQSLDDSWDYSALHVTTNFASQNELANDHLSCLVMHANNMLILGFSHPVIETFREVIIDVIYLVVFGEFASSPHIWMIVIQPGYCIQTLFFYLLHVVLELVNCEALGCCPHILSKQGTRVVLLHVLSQMPHTFSVLHS
uniref:Uncharacterized protein n=1 Tax=Arundo donax TaxID=35708 RepID=A0A0A9DTE7_ARUDO